MNVLVTGASGFLGSHLVDFGLKKGYKIWAGVRKSSNLQYLKGKDIELSYIDLNKMDSINNSLRYIAESGQKIDILIHNAGITKVKKENEFIEGNADASLLFYKMILDHFPDLKLIVYISSLAASGPGDSNMKPISIDDKDDPISPYGLSKKVGESYLRDLNHVPHLIFRPTTIYGPRESKTLPITKIMKSGLEINFSPSKQRLSFIHAYDLCELIYRAISMPEHFNGTYLVGDGKAYKLSDYRDIIKKKLDLKTLRLNINHELLAKLVGLTNVFAKLIGKNPHVTPAKIRDISSLNWQINVEPLVRDFGFQPEYDLEKGLEMTLDWYLEKNWI